MLVKRGELGRKLKALGWIFHAHRGNHDEWRHPVKPHQIWVPCATRRDRNNQMLVGRIAKQGGPWWSAECEAIGAFTQGKSRRDAAAMLVELVEVMVERPGFTVTVTEVGKIGPHEHQVLVDASEPALLAARVLKYQREVHGLSLADVAERLGAKSRNAYASYEQGRTEPTLSKFRELLGVVAPEMAFTVALRGAAQPAKPARMRTRRAAKRPAARRAA